MKQPIVLFLVLLCASGCANVGLVEDMQPDHSYRILAMGNPSASMNFLKDQAQRRASLLCPKGYDQKAEVPEPDTRSRYTLIVMCK